MKKISFFLYLLLSSLSFVPSGQAENSDSFDNEITIIAKPQPSEALTSPQPVSVIEGRRLDEKRAQTATDLVEDAPGVAAVTTGVGVSKPVVRGLSGPRVLIVSDGVRQEFQQWGDEHMASLDPFGIARAEVLRGPNSLLYGSDALGGVIAFSEPPLPTAEDGTPRLSGKTDLQYLSNNHQWAGGISLFGAAGNTGYRFGVSGRHAGDYRTPVGHVSNSGIEDLNGRGAVGFRPRWGECELKAERVGQKLELPEADSNASPFQKVKDQQIVARARMPVNTAAVEATIARQKNEREEFAQEDAEQPILNFLTTTDSIDIKAHHAPFGGAHGTVGLSADASELTSDKEEQLIPSNKTRSTGAFVYEELGVGPLTFSAGLRGDREKLEVRENGVLGVAAQTKKYNQMTGAVGAVWRVAMPVAVALNVGRGYRAPTAFELYSNGEHEGSGRFEVGDADLKPERSLNIDVIARASVQRLKTEVALFRNKISEFIFIEPTGATFDDPDTVEIEDVPVFQYTQADATLSGGEFSLEAWAAPWLVFGAGYDRVRGQNNQTGDDLPSIPPDRWRFGVRFEFASGQNAIGRSYLDLESRLYRRQTRVDPNETETPGYALWNVATGIEIKVAQTRMNLNAGVENVTNKKYVDHLSRNKVVGLLNPGRNFYLKASIPFGIIK